MKKQFNLSSFVGFLVLIATVVGFGFWVNDYQNQQANAETPIVQAARDTTASLVIDDGSGQKSYISSYKLGDTAFDLIRSVSEREGIELKYDQYDFGVLINSVKGQTSDNEQGMYWLFYVNGQMASVGVDSYVIKPHDTIELRYGDGF